MAKSNIIDDTKNRIKNFDKPVKEAMKKMKKKAR